MRRKSYFFSTLAILSLSLGVFFLGGQPQVNCACSLSPGFQEPPITVMPPYPLPPRPFPPEPIYPPVRRDEVLIRTYQVNVTIDNQVATTRITQDFANIGQTPAEGAYLFPLPMGAAVSNLVMTVNGQPIQAQILDAEHARDIYNEAVRRLRDPALLQYVGQGAIQANVFPIPPGDERKIEITYSQIVAAQNGLINYTYPLPANYISRAPVQQFSLSVDVTSNDPISSVYSPDPLVVIARIDDHHIRAGYETTNYQPIGDFRLYYGSASGKIDANLLTYRDSADQDGYFMLMLTPPVAVDTSRVIPRDVLIVLDQSGSMQGPKWEQARNAVSYILKHLNAGDHFNVIVFSTGYRIFANTLQTTDQADAAISWVNGLQAEGGTDINAALAEALSMTKAEHPTTLLFMTDGLPTEGVTDLNTIIENVKSEAEAVPNLHLFAFGVGDDVNTYLLDSLSTDFHGASVYVRPADNIEDKVSTLYNTITSPVLTNLKLDFGSVTVDDMYPANPLPDLFAGNQVIVVGRFRQSGSTTVTLTGDQNGTPLSLTYPALSFPANAGGQEFIPRLWATRKIGVLLNQIRLHGETSELVNEVTLLSVRYGIITPYTSYLIQEGDITAQGGSARGGIGQPPGTSSANKAPLAPDAQTGSAAVQAAQNANGLAGASAPAAAPTSAPAVNGQTADGQANAGGVAIQQVGDRTFVARGDAWVDTQYVPTTMKLTPLTFLSDDYFKLLDAHPELNAVFALGTHVIVVVGDTVYEVKAS